MIHSQLVWIHFLVLLSEAVMVFSCLQTGLSEGEAGRIPGVFVIPLVQSHRWLPCISKYMNKLSRVFSVVRMLLIPL